MIFMLRALGALLIGLTLAIATALPAAAAVKVTVNGIAITDIQISQRLKLFALEGRSGAKGAQQELIDEAIMISEARRLNINVTEAQVDEAVLTVARNIKVSRDKLMEILQQQGVNTETLRDRLRAAIAWARVTEQAVNPNVQISDAELDEKAASQLSAESSFDYILKEILFVGKGSSGRTAQANQYKKSFSGCDTAVQLSLSYTDAAVTDLGRRHATQLPEAIAKELAKLNVGGITKPRVVENGVSMLAICSKSEARDVAFIKDNLRQESGTGQLKAKTDEYLKQLRAKARIVYE
jgi:peptidyl-prolyl cis-trans isomerase SurA